MWGKLPVIELSDDELESYVAPAAVQYRPRLPEPDIALSISLQRQPLTLKQPESRVTPSVLGKFDKFRCQKGRAATDDSREKGQPLQDQQRGKRKRVLEDSESEGEGHPGPTRAGRTLAAAVQGRQLDLGDQSEDDTPPKQAASRKNTAAAVESVPDSDDDDADNVTLAERRSMLVDLTREKDYQHKALEALQTQAQQQQQPWDDEDGADGLDEVLAACEDMAARIRSLVGDTSQGRAADTDTQSRATHSSLQETCGEAAQYLKPYQLVGVNWLLLHNAAGAQGSILADEMGLGKTCQLICYLGALRQQAYKGPHLIVAPASILNNWQRELAMWCPNLNVVPYFGADRHEQRHSLQACREGADSGIAGSEHESESASEDDEFQDASQQPSPAATAADAPGDSSAPRAPFDVMLTCYTLFERDTSDQRVDRAFLRSYAWSHIILDEAHAVKNRASGRSQRLEKLAERAKRRVMLTGTPLQNDLQELYNLMQFLNPSTFRHQPQPEAAQGEEEEAALVQRMKSILAPFVLRRLKVEVAGQLPPKSQEVKAVDMHEVQKAAYEAGVAQFREEVAARKAAHAAASSSGQALVKKLGARRVSNAFVHLRKIAQHPLLVRRLFEEGRLQQMAHIARRKQTFGPASLERILEELQGYSDFSLHSLACSDRHFNAFRLEDERVMEAGKCALLAELLPALQAKGSRPLIFSQWTQVLDVLEWLMDHLKLPYSRLDGSTAVADRQAIVDQFNHEPDAVFAMMMTTRAGGQGLNLTGADTVILHDVDFNPQIDRQAEDRCHRLGQIRPVTIYRLVTSASVDEGIFSMAQRKLRLDAAVIGAISSAANSDSSTAAESGAMGQLLAQLLAEPVKSGSGNAELGIASNSRASEQKHETENKLGDLHSAIEIE